MQFVLGRQLSNRPLARDRLQSRLCFEPAANRLRVFIMNRTFRRRPTLNPCLRNRGHLSAH